jgi:hypothetical protein
VHVDATVAVDDHERDHERHGPPDGAVTQR